MDESSHMNVCATPQAQTPPPALTPEEEQEKEEG